MGIALDHGVRRQGVYFETELSERDQALLALSNIEFEVVFKNASDYYTMQRAKYATRRATLSENCLPDYGTGFEINDPEDFELGSFNGFLTFDEIVGHLDNMSAKYPNLITTKSAIGDILTYENRPIWSVKLSDNPNEDERATETQVLHTSLHHAREPVSASQLIYFMYYLLENYASDAGIRHLVDNNELFFVPCVNPDGYVLDEELAQVFNDVPEYAFWRKNLRDNNANGVVDVNFDGVDLNRNYPLAWGPDFEGSSSNPASAIYHGPGPASEPETQAIIELCEANEFALAMNVHTYGRYLIHPWSYLPFDPTTDSLIYRTFATAMTLDNQYTVGTVAETLDYLVNGDSDDWMHGETDTKNRIWAFTPEVGADSDGFYPAPERIVPLCREALLMNLNSVRVLGNYYGVRATEGDPVLLSETSGTISIDATRYGLSDEGVFLSIEAASDNIAAVGFESQFVSTAFSESETFDVAYELDEAAPLDEDVVFRARIDYTADSYSDTFLVRKRFVGGAGSQGLTTIYSDASDEGNSAPITMWLADDEDEPVWGETTTEFYSAPRSITDSPNGNYGNNLDESLAFAETIDLTEVERPRVQFWARWDIEADYDYVQLIATDLASGTETALCGEFTTTGNFYLPEDEPVYDGIQSEWVLETVDLSPFTGQQISLAFRIFTDGFVTRDGFYFDDFQVLAAVATPTSVTEFPSAEPTWSVFPNPASGQVQLISQNDDHSLKTIVVTDLNGRELLRRDATVDPSRTIDISTWATGMYFIRFETGSGWQAAQKLIVAQ